MRGRIEMNTLKQFASRISIMVLAVALLGTGALLTGDKNVVEAEKLATVSLTNKATGLTTEASPPSTRSAPASRKNASTVYVTMTDVNTSNTVQNSHLINSNKVVITVTESDFNTTTDVDSGPKDIGGSAIAAGAQASVKHLKVSELERKRQRVQVEKLRSKLDQAGIPHLKNPSHIVPVMIKNPVKCNKLSIN